MTRVGAEAAFSIAASISPLVTRPSLPEPGTVAASTPLSADSLRTDGASGASAGGDFSSGFGRGSSGPALTGLEVSLLMSGRAVVLSGATALEALAGATAGSA